MTDGVAVHDNELVRNLREVWHDTAPRQAAWLARMSIGPRLAPGLRAFARTRETPERSPIVDALTEASDGPYAEYKAALDRRKREQFGLTDDQLLAPWHYDDPFVREPSADLELNPDRFFVQADIEGLARKTFAARGHDIRPLLREADLYERPDKLQQAWWSGRQLIANIRPDQRWMRKLLEVFARAIGDPVLGARLARLPDEPDWLREIVGVPTQRIEPIRDQLAARHHEHLLLRVRWGILQTHFEQALYADPDSDLDARWWQLRERYLGLPRPTDRQAPDWAAVPELVLAPGCAGQRLLDEVAASELAGGELIEQLST